jgi:hypothetical protein
MAASRGSPESEEPCGHTSHGAQCNEEKLGNLYFSFYRHGLGPLARAHSELIKCESYGQSAGLLGRWISLAQGRYLHRTTQTQNKHTHPCLEWHVNP